MLRVTGKFENDRVEVTVELEADECDDQCVGEAVKLARASCKKALVTRNYNGY